MCTEEQLIILEERVALPEKRNRFEQNILLLQRKAAPRQKQFPTTNQLYGEVSANAQEYRVCMYRSLALDVNEVQKVHPRGELSP